MSSSDSDSGVLRRKSIWGPKSLRGGLYKRSQVPLNLHTQVPLNLTKPIDTAKRKRRRKKPAYWGDSSSDESSSGWTDDSGFRTPDSGFRTPDYGSGRDSDEQEQKYSSKAKTNANVDADDKKEQTDSSQENTNAKVEVDDEGYESPPTALGSAQKALEPAVAQAAFSKKVDEISESWKTAGEFAKANLAAQMGKAAGSSLPSDKPAESDPFSAQPIGAAGSSDDSHSSSSKQPALRALKPLDPVEEAVKEKNLVSERKLADLAADERALRALKARRDQALQEAQRALTAAQGTKASSHARVTDVFSAAAKAGSQADQVADLDAALAYVQEKQKDEKRKIEARELDPGIQTEVETDAESRSAAAAAPGSTSIIARWQEMIKASEPYQKAETFINKIPVDATQEMMTGEKYMNMMQPYMKEFAGFLKSESTKFKGSNPRSSIALAEGYWTSLMEHGWKIYQFKYAKESRIRARAHELEQRYFDERKVNREERKKEREARKNHSKRLKDLEQQAALGMNRDREQESGSDTETLSEPESGPDAEPDFVKEAEEEVVEEEIQEKLSMRPDVTTIAYHTLRQIPVALDLATYSQTMNKEYKLNPANAILILKRFDEILAADSQKLAKKGLTRMPGFSIQGTGKIVKTGKMSSYTFMKAVIVKRISELEKKQHAGSKASSSSSSSSRSSGRAK